MKCNCESKLGEANALVGVGIDGNYLDVKERGSQMKRNGRGLHILKLRMS